MSSIFNKELIVLDLEAPSKNQVIKELAKLIEKYGSLIDFNDFVEQVFKREEISATSVVFDIAIPHGKSDSVKNVVVAFARLKQEVQWSEEEKAKYVFLVAAPKKGAGDTELRILTELARKIMRQEFRNKLKSAENANGLLEILTEIF